MNSIQIKSLYIKEIICLMILGLFSTSAKAQINYVQNPSFEVYDTCPDWTGQIKYTMSWSNLIDHTGGSVDFMHSCANPNLLVGVPNNIGYQMPHSGLGYARLGLFSHSTSAPNEVNLECMNNKLTKPLIANKQYCVKAHLSLWNGAYCIIDGFGMYFDNGTYSNLTSVTAQIDNPDFNYLSDTLGWMEVSGTFVADGTEEYINVGNFKKIQTHYLPLANDPGNGYYAAFYYIDDVSVIESDLPVFAGNDTALVNVGDSLYLGRPVEIGLECVWYNWAGDSIGTGAGIWVKPGHTQPYIVEQVLCGVITRDTVYVSMGTGVVSGVALEGVRVFPNPSEGVFTVSIPNMVGGEVDMVICDVSGRRVYEGVLMGRESVVRTGLASGVYVLYLEDRGTGARVVRRVAVE